MKKTAALFSIKDKKPFDLSFGERGEILGWHFLVSQGYELLEKNYRCTLGEIDVVARRGKVLAFIEIKTRQTHRSGTPAEAVDIRKQKKIIQVAKFYLKEHNADNQPLAFDVLAITWRAGQKPEFNLIQDAFESESYD